MEKWKNGKIGDAHLSLGDVKNAMEYYENQLKIAIELRDRSGEGDASGNLGKVHFKLGNFKKAISYFERHLNIAKELVTKLEKERRIAISEFPIYLLDILKEP